MQISLEQFATEVREEIGLFGPIEAKVLAVWLGLELVAMPYPCEGLCEGPCEYGRPRTAAYYGMAGELECQLQIARIACASLLMDVGVEFPRMGQVDQLAALLCGPALRSVPISA
jgi:hypothetical protein